MASLASWLGLGLLMGSGALVNCQTDWGDPEDLHGVFEKPKASHAKAATATKAKATANKKSVATPRPELALKRFQREPVAGRCIEAAGQAAVPDRRPARRPACRYARVLEQRGKGGLPRYGCVYQPRKAEEKGPLPLVIFFHRDLDSPATIRRSTRLQRRSRNFELSADPTKRGFVLLAPQARKIRYGKRWATDFHSDENSDIALVDDQVDQLVAEGRVDRRQIYTMGAGRGGQMAALYAMMRPSRVAAFAVYGTHLGDLNWSCEAEPTPAAVLYRACDSVTPCADVERWLGKREASKAATFGLRLSSSGRSEPSCVLSERQCRPKRGRSNHNRWPKRREKDMLRYLARFSVNVPSTQH